MALNINNPETEKLARELARRRKQGLTDTLTEGCAGKLSANVETHSKKAGKTFIAASRKSSTE
jgi:hypothetical protein